MSNITRKFTKSNYGVIVPYQRGHYEVYVTHAEDGEISLVYHKAGEAMPAFDSDRFDTIEDADAFIVSELKGLDLRKVRDLDATNQY